MTKTATLVGLAVEDDLGVAEVGLGLAGRVGQRDEDLGGAGPPGADGDLDHGQAALVAVLGPEPVEDPLGGVPLLLGGLPVVLEDLMDDRQERARGSRAAWAWCAGIRAARGCRGSSGGSSSGSCTRGRRHAR